MYIHGLCLVAVLHVIYLLECSALSITIHVDVNLYFCATTSTRLTHTQPKNERWGLLSHCLSFEFEVPTLLKLLLAWHTVNLRLRAQVSYPSRDHNLESGLSGCYFKGCHARALTVDVQK